MTTEELKVKITVDTSEATSKIRQVKSDLGGLGKAGGDGGHQASAGFEELKDSMEKVRNAQWADIILENMDKIKASTAEVRKHWQLMKSGFKNAGEEFLGAFNFSNFDVGEDGIKGYWDSMKIQFKESAKSIEGSLANVGKAFISLGGVVKAVIPPMVAKIALVVGAIATWVAAIKNAITASRQLKEEFSEAVKIGLDLETYREWSFILESVGVGADKLSDFLKTLADEQNAVREGSEDIIQAFNKIGLSAEEVAGMNQGELFSRTVSGLQGVESEVERTAIAYKIFGEDAAQLTGVVKLNNEQMAEMRNHFYALGGGVSQSFIQKSNELQTSLHYLRTAWSGLKNSLAEGFMPLVNSLVNGLTKAIVAINVFVRAVFGFEMITGKTGKEHGGIGGTFDGIGESAGGANDQVNKLKRSLLGFDELNKVPAATTTSGYDFTIPTDIEVKPLTELFNLGDMAEKISKWGDEIRALVPLALVGLGAVGAVLFALSGNWIGAIACAALAGIGLVAMTSGEGGFQGYIDSFNAALDGLLAPCTVAVGAIGMVIFALTGNWVGAIACAALAGLGLYAMSEQEGGIGGAIDRLNEKTKGLVGPCTTAVGAVGMVIGALLMNIPMVIACAALCGVGVYMSNKDQSDEHTSKYNKKVRNIINIAMSAIGVLGCVVCILTGNIPGALAFGLMAGIGLNNLGKDNGWWEAIGKALKNWWEGIKKWFNEKVKPVFTKDYWAKKWETIKTATSEKLDSIKESISKWWQEKIVKWWKDKVAPIFTKDYWTKKWETISTTVSTGLEKIKTKLSEKWSGVKEWFNTNVASKFTKDYWTTKFNNIRDGASTALDKVKSTIQEKWNGVKAWFSTNVGSKFTAQYWTEKFGSIKTGAKNAFNGIIGVVEEALNKIIRKLNSISFTLPSWLPFGLGDKTIGFNFKEVKIPRLAEGGIATRSIFANIGENGKEAVLPLENNTQWMDKLADKIASRNSGPTRIALVLDGKELGYATIDSINNITKQTGTLPLVLA